MALASERLAQPRTAASAEERTGALDGGIKILAYAVLVFVAFLMFVPFLYSIGTSLKTTAEANTLRFSNLFWPENPTSRAYDVIRDTDIGLWFLNSTLVAVVWVVARAIFGAMAGYAFARMTFPGKNIVFLMILSTLMIPSMVTIIPKFMILRELGLLNGYGALTVPFLTDAFGIFLMKQFFESIPKELEEAARVDGASRYRMFLQIILPNAMPAVTALAIFSFQGSWNAFLEPLIFVSNADRYTLPLGLATLKNSYYTDFPVVMAGAVITTLPIALFYLFFQRFFIEGSTSSGIKG
ncbi:MAG: N-Acetyl-D-glucosamine ABC transport system, permease protein 2 [uncultured Thermomicrobiales bacterium]|uniref:N-Acetyl-D-glucosamine ABC transport system, permease protein 2 n=1 Tax=uncultured Thermomicrobiales bacterium TaxID=1645740 RepID=A0A6J4UAS5_9BACT|nr:MAG: N-Acetyl-D-glucosamine ABC transport system, permease protein 2 [uncultured Thermomicrobiales bacterium]